MVPDSILAPTHDMMASRKSFFNDVFKNMNLEFVDLDVKKYFKSVGVNPIAFVVADNGDYSGTVVNTNDGQIELNIENMTFIPKDVSLMSLGIHNKILTQVPNESLFKLRWTKDVKEMEKSTQEERTKTHRYPVFDHHSNNDIRWSDIKDNDFETPKFLISYIGKYKCLLDAEGQMNAKRQVSVRFFQPGEDPESVRSFYDSELIHFVMNSNKWTQYLLSQILNYIPHPPFDRVYGDEDVYDHFELTQAERDYVKSVVNGKPPKMVKKAA